MPQDDKDISLQTLKDIHGIMERSSRFLSLSGWSGVWAGAVALIGAFIARYMLAQLPGSYRMYYNDTVNLANATHEYQQVVIRFVVLAFSVLIVAFAGGVYFTWRKAQKDGGTIWNRASKRMVIELLLPLLAGGLFAIAFLINGLELYVAATCLTFYGLGLINGSKYTRSDIKYLGLLEVALGCICLFVRGYGLLFWTIGFGVLHILYGIIMWRKYDKA